MSTLVSGSAGLIGSALVPSLNAQGYAVKTLVRHTAEHPSQIQWDPLKQTLLPGPLDGVDAVVHLAGEGIASGRWTEARKHAIHESRAVGTRLLSESLAHMSRPPKVLISASAIGYYGDRGPEILKETSPAGQGFLPNVCKAWESATAPAAQKGIRVVHLRFGIVLSPAGGALKKMLFPFKMGVGGILGSGTQYMSWISIDDVVSVILHALKAESLTGAVNTVAPNPVTNTDFTKTLGRVLHRPTLFPMPAFAARLAFGELADALLLSSARVDPAVLAETGYAFQWPDLENALRHLLTARN